MCVIARLCGQLSNRALQSHGQTTLAELISLVGKSSDEEIMVKSVADVLLATPLVFARRPVVPAEAEGEQHADTAAIAGLRGQGSVAYLYRDGLPLKHPVALNTLSKDLQRSAAAIEDARARVSRRRGLKGEGGIESHVEVRLR